MQLLHSSTPDPAHPASILPGLIQSGLSQEKKINLFSVFGKGEPQGKEEMLEKQEYKKDTRLHKKKTERARELRVSQALEEAPREKVTGLGKGLGRQNSVLFSSLLALVFQSGRKYSKPGRQHSLVCQVQPGNEASLALFSPLRAASSQKQHPGTCTECGGKGSS